MIFEDAFTEKQSEIISMFLEVIGDNVDTIYVFIQSDEWSAMETCAFGVKGSILGNLEAGISPVFSRTAKGNRGGSGRGRCGIVLHLFPHHAGQCDAVCPYRQHFLTGMAVQ